jgi:hypothetical protein
MTSWDEVAERRRVMYNKERMRDVISTCFTDKGVDAVSGNSGSGEFMLNPMPYSE